MILRETSIATCDILRGKSIARCTRIIARCSQDGGNPVISMAYSTILRYFIRHLAILLVLKMGKSIARWGVLSHVEIGQTK